MGPKDSLGREHATPQHVEGGTCISRHKASAERLTFGCLTISCASRTTMVVNNLR